MIERKYLSLAKAAKILNCDVEDIVHWASHDKTKIGIPFQANGFEPEIVIYDPNCPDLALNVELENNYSGFGFVDPGYLINAELTGVCTFNCLNLEDGRSITFPPDDSEFSYAYRYATIGFAIDKLFMRTEELDKLKSNVIQPNATSHKLKNRNQPLDAEIKVAQKNALDPNDVHSVFTELIKMAENKIGCLLGVQGDAIKYRGASSNQTLTKDALSKRLNRQ